MYTELRIYRISFSQLTFGVVLIELIMNLHPTIAVPIDQLKGIDGVEEMSWRVVSCQRLRSTDLSSKILQTTQSMGSENWLCYRLL